MLFSEIFGSMEEHSITLLVNLLLELRLKPSSSRAYVIATHLLRLVILLSEYDNFFSDIRSRSHQDYIKFNINLY